MQVSWVCVKKMPRYGATVLTWMSLYESRAFGFLTVMSLDSSSIPGTWSPIPFMRMNFVRMPADFFDPFTAASHAVENIVDNTLAATFTCKSPLSGNVLKYFIRFDIIKEAGFDWERKLWLSSRRYGHNLHFTLITSLHLRRIWLIMDMTKNTLAVDDGSLANRQVIFQFFILRNSSIFSCAVHIYNIFN